MLSMIYQLIFHERILINQISCRLTPIFNFGMYRDGVNGCHGEGENLRVPKPQVQGTMLPQVQMCCHLRDGGLPEQALPGALAAVASASNLAVVHHPEFHVLLHYIMSYLINIMQ